MYEIYLKMKRRPSFAKASDGKAGDGKKAIEAVEARNGYGHLPAG